MCVCVCVYTYMFIYIYMYIYICMYVYVHNMFVGTLFALTVKAASADAGVSVLLLDICIYVCIYR